MLLESNDSRHADTKSTVPTVKEVKLCLEFSMVLVDLLFVLPARARRGKVEASGTKLDEQLK